MSVVVESSLTNLGLHSAQVKAQPRRSALALDNFIQADFIVAHKFVNSEPQHKIYVEQYGNQNGVPLVLVHGGPAYTFLPEHICFIPEEKFRLIVVHQRGVGKSLPSGECQGNTSAHLIEDLEQVKQYLGIDSWHVFGWSWGATIGTAYAEKYPESCRSLTNYGTFLGLPQEEEYFYSQLKQSSPEAYARYKKWGNPEEEKFLLSQKFHATIGTLEEDLAIRDWCGLDDEQKIDLERRNNFRVNVSYQSRGFDLAPVQLLTNAYKLQDLGVHLFYGANDPVVPLESTQNLAQALSRARIEVINSATHELSGSSVQEKLFEHFSLL
jgi:proline iminopeptidase